MLYNYYNKLKQILTQNNHDLEISSNDQFIRIEPKIQKWDNEQWKEYIQNIEFQYMDQQLVLQQLKSNFDYSLRPLIYPWIANRTVSLQTDYKILAQTPCSQDNIIFRDIERTHSGLDFYKSKRKSSKKNIQRASQQLESVKSVIDDKMLSDLFSLNQKRLFYLLRAYANIDPETGYVQGMNYIMGLLLYLLDDGNSLYEAEAKAFQTFLHIHLKLNWSKTYNKSMKKVKALIQHFEYLLETNLQDVYKIIKGSGQPFHFFLDSYFFGLMTYRTPIEFSAKIIDIFIVQGEQIIFDVLLRVFILNRQTIKSINDKDELTQFLKDILVSSIEKYGIQALIPNSEIII